VLLQFVCRAKDGRIFPAESRVSLITVGGRELIMGLQSDITERRAAERAVRRLNEKLESRVRERTAELERVNHELESFSYSVSHDLRAPLRPLDGFSQALLEDYSDKLDETGRGYLTKIRSGAQRMGQLIDDLLRLSRIRGADVRPDRFNVSELVHTITGELVAADPTRQVQFVIEPGLMLHADPGLVRIALENLLRNAWKFSSKKSTARIEFGRLEERGEPVYFVRDDGVGFDTSYASRMCQPFQRFHTQKQFDGTGIGLAIVERILRHHQGRIWAESAPDQGATFFFTLRELER
jgi:light-regulated signal transduction histidine kinase (bacteriophytochrome)